MTPVAPHITAFLRERLPIERRASEHTCDSYAFAFQLLFSFASVRLGIAPSQIDLEQIDAPLVLAFLNHLENERGNSTSSRNVRLAAIKSFMRFVEYRVPSAMEQIRRVLAIPTKKTDSRLIPHLSRIEMQAVLDAPDPTSRLGVRDRAMLHVAVAAGLRVSELIGLCVDDLTLEPRPSIRVFGKGRKERALPLWKETAVALRSWLAIRGDLPARALFPNARGRPMTRSGFEYILKKHGAAAALSQPSLQDKQLSPHVLRHTCALMILGATHDIRKVSLWLGHSSVRTTEIYLRVDPAEKLEAIEAVVPPTLRRGEFRPPDKLIEMLRRPAT